MGECLRGTRTPLLVTTVVLFNKPHNVLSQFTDAAGRTTLKTYIDNPDLRVAGRLDRDSEGLLVLTDSGALAHKVTHPDNHWSKCYWAQIEGTPADRELQPLRDGIDLKDGGTLPARARVMDEPSVWPRNPPIRQRKSISDSWIEITLKEGRNRQVRRMCAAIGFPVLRLIRYRVGSWTLDGISPGELREIQLQD